MQGTGQLSSLFTPLISSCASTAELTAELILKISLGIGSSFKTQWFLWLGQYFMSKYISKDSSGNLRMYVYIDKVVLQVWVR